MSSVRQQLSVWATVAEADEIRAAAERDDRTVSKWLLRVALAEARKSAEEEAK